MKTSVTKHESANSRPAELDLEDTALAAVIGGKGDLVIEAPAGNLPRNPAQILPRSVQRPNQNGWGIVGFPGIDPHGEKILPVPPRPNW